MKPLNVYIKKVHFYHSQITVDLCYIWLFFQKISQKYMHSFKFIGVCSSLFEYMLIRGQCMISSIMCKARRIRKVRRYKTKI